VNIRPVTAHLIQRRLTQLVQEFQQQASAPWRIVGRVVRRFAGGFALKFFIPLSRASVEGMAIVGE
jgi:hypothetical protein